MGPIWAFAYLPEAILEHSGECFQNGLNQPSVFKVYLRDRVIWLGAALVALWARSTGRGSAAYLPKLRFYIEQPEHEAFAPLDFAR